MIVSMNLKVKLTKETKINKVQARRTPAKVRLIPKVIIAALLKNRNLKEKFKLNKWIHERKD